MSVAAALVSVLVVVVSALLGAVLRGRLGSRRLAVRRRVVVNLLNGQAFAGVLWARHSGFLVLRGASLIEPGSNPAPVDGEVIVERGQVAFVQAYGG